MFVWAIVNQWDCFMIQSIIFVWVAIQPAKLALAQKMNNALNVLRDFYRSINIPAILNASQRIPT